jgi:hypothetical protein
MTKKTSFGSWLGIAEEASWAAGIAGDPTGMHIIPEWEIKTPAPKRESVWAHERDRPVMTTIGTKEPSEIAVTSKNLWNLQPLYFLLGAGSYEPTDNTGVIQQSSGAMKTFALHGNSNGTERTFIGCVVNDFTLNIPKEGGNITAEWNAKSADWVDETKTKPTAITSALLALNGTYSFNKDGAAIPDVFMGGKVVFNNNINTDVPDLPNGRIYEPSLQNLTVEVEAEFRIDSADSFLEAYESGSTGCFDMRFVVKDADSTGFLIDLTGMQLQLDGYSEAVPTAEKGIIEQTVKFVQSEDFILKDIQVSGVDFT